MPTISTFYGIRVLMYFNDHEPAHFHATYAGRSVKIEIETGRVLEGSLRPRAMRLLREWRNLHLDELRDNWLRAREGAPLSKIDPLR